MNIFKKFSTLEGNIYKLYILKWFHFAMFIIPIIVLYFQNQGLTMQQVFIIQAAFSIGIVLFEIPSGYLADVLGRKKSIILGYLFVFLWATVYRLAGWFLLFLLAELLRWIGSSFVSWADSALLYDTLLQTKKEDQFKKIEGRNSSIGSVVESITAFIGWLLFAVSVKLPFLVQSLVLLCAFLFAFTLKEPKIHEQLDKKKNPWKNILKIVKYSIHDHKEIKRLIMYSAVLATATLSMVRFIQPYVKDVGFPIAWIGLLRAGLNLSVAVFYLLAHRYEKRLWRRLSLISLLILIAVGYFLTGTFYSLRWIAFVLIFYFVRAINGPVLTDYINRLVSSNIRATVLSVKALAMRVMFTIIWPFLWWVTDIYSLQTALLMSWGLFLVLWTIALIFLQRNKAL